MSSNNWVRYLFYKNPYSSTIVRLANFRSGQAAVIRSIYRHGDDAVVILIRQMIRNLPLLEGRIKFPGDPLNQNITNSSKPPSCAGVNRPSPRSPLRRHKKISAGSLVIRWTRFNATGTPDSIHVRRRGPWVFEPKTNTPGTRDEMPVKISAKSSARRPGKAAHFWNLGCSNLSGKEININSSRSRHVKNTNKLHLPDFQA
jgi:hypothetical protein